MSPGFRCSSPLTGTHVMKPRVLSTVLPPELEVEWKVRREHQVPSREALPVFSLCCHPQIWLRATPLRDLTKTPAAVLLSTTWSVSAYVG